MRSICLLTSDTSRSADLPKTRGIDGPIDKESRKCRGQYFGERFPLLWIFPEKTEYLHETPRSCHIWGSRCPTRRRSARQALHTHNFRERSHNRRYQHHYLLLVFNWTHEVHILWLQLTCRSRFWDPTCEHTRTRLRFLMGMWWHSPVVVHCYLWCRLANHHPSQHNCIQLLQVQSTQLTMLFPRWGLG